MEEMNSASETAEENTLNSTESNQGEDSLNCAGGEEEENNSVDETGGNEEEAEDPALERERERERGIALREAIHWESEPQAEVYRYDVHGLSSALGHH